MKALLYRMRRSLHLILLQFLAILLLAAFCSAGTKEMTGSSQQNQATESDKDLFSLVYTHDSPTSQATALVDIFGDGNLDLAIAAKRRVYFVRNRGDGSFFPQDTVAADNSNGWGMHDFNRDGRMDLFVAQHQSRINDSWLNRGDGTFETKDLGNETKGNVRTVLFADFDGDGYTDSYHSVSAFQTNHAGCELHPGKPDGTFGPDIIESILQPTIPNFWYATANPPGRGREKWANKMMKGAVVRDFDRDGKPDIVTGAYADRGYQEGGRGGYGMQWVDRQDRGLFILHNRSTPGRIQFAEVAKSAVGPNAYGNSSRDWNVYSVIPLDYDRDGDLDLFVGAVLRPAGRGQKEDTVAVRFLENTSKPGDIHFLDRTEEAGFAYINKLSPSRRAQINIAAGQAIDYDNDGFTDLILANRVDPDKTDYPFVHLYRNLGNGSFKQIPYERHHLGSASGGISSGGRDLVGGDLNNDGKIDVVLNDGAVGGFDGLNNTRVYENQTHNNNHWIKLGFVENERNTPAIGARVSLFRAGTSELIGYEEVRTDFCYRSKRSPVLHFGLGDLQEVDARVVTRQGKEYSFKKLAADRAHQLNLQS